MIYLALDNTKSDTLQVQLYEQIRQAIMKSDLSPGDSLPSTRMLADDLGVSRNTVIYAYDRLLSEGYLDARGRRGTFVAESLPQELLRASVSQGRIRAKRLKVPLVPSSAGWQQLASRRTSAADVRIDLNPDWQWRHAFPAKAWKRISADILSGGASAMVEPLDPAGLWELRSEIAKYIGPARGVSATPEQIIITSGPMDALNVLARLFISDGASVVVEDPCRRRVLDVFRSYGAHTVPVHVGSDGIDVRLIREQTPKLIYLTPTHQFPLGVTMSVENRLRLLDHVADTPSFVIEDDHQGDIRYDGPPVRALYASAKEQSVIFLGDFSNTMGAGFRLGYMVLPEELIGPASAVKRLQGGGPPWLEQVVMSEFLANGEYSKHLRRLKSANRSRRDSLIDALKTAFGTVDILGAAGGISLAWNLGDDAPGATQVREAARRHGVAVYDLPSRGAVEMTSTRYEWRTLFLGYASVSDKQIWEAISILSKAVRH
jgi:GntR family transcriptional regulator/MocR family aminotransferase